MTADHWGFVAAAYGITALALGGYWRRLLHLERGLKRPTLRGPGARGRAREGRRRGAAR